MTTEEKLECCIRARIYGEWDNPNLLKIGALSYDPIEDIMDILNYGLA